MSNSVLISTATKGNVRAETYDWRLREIMRLQQLGIGVGAESVITRKTLMHARNVQVENFMRSVFSHIFLLDSDCLPQDNTIPELLSYKKPIISAPHSVVINGESGIMVVDPAPDGNGYIQHLPLRGLQGPDVRVGCGGLLIERGVFETLGRPWFRFLYDDSGFLTSSEDFDFCERALCNGYEIWAQCDLVQRHKIASWI